MRVKSVDLHVAPHTTLITTRVAHELHVSCLSHIDAFRLDLANVMHAESPWLEAIDVRDGKAPWVLLSLPRAKGVLLSHLWTAVGVTGLTRVVLEVVRSLAKTGGAGALPLHSVLCDVNGGVSFVPSFHNVYRACAADSFWGSRERAEYAVGRHGPHLNHRLASTASELVHPGEFQRSGPLPDVLSSSLAHLAPLDALVSEGLREIRHQSEPAPLSIKTWAKTLAAMNIDAPPLGDLVQDGWDSAPADQKWE